MTLQANIANLKTTFDAECSRVFNVEFRSFEKLPDTGKRVVAQDLSRMVIDP